MKAPQRHRRLQQRIRLPRQRLLPYPSSSPFGEPPTFISVQENVFDRRLRIELGQELIFKRDSDLQLYFRAEEGQAPLCNVATGCKGYPAPDSEPHQG